LIFNVKQNNFSTLKKTEFQKINFNKKLIRFYGTEKTISVPQMGDSITEGTLAEWVVGLNFLFKTFSEENSVIKEDDVIAKIETDKVTVEIRAPEAGTFLKKLAKEEETVAVGQQLFVYSTEVSGSATQAKEKAPEPKKEEVKPVKKEESKPTTPEPVKTQPKKETTSTPSSKQETVVVSENKERRVPMTRIRQTISKRLKDSQNTYAMLTTFNEIDMSALMKLRNDYKDNFQKKHGVKFGFMSAFMKASTYALMDQPSVNAVIDGKDIVYRDYVDISVAVATPNGLVVPVIRNCQDLTLADLEKTMGELGEKARKNQITLPDMQGGTFTISNGGVFGSMMGTPIINPPQSAILGMHGIKKRAVVVDDKIEIRPMMYVALTYDHRLIDGREAVLFLVKVKDLIENPLGMLLE
jgi:2-oxoglutarate dehydrogenase E2 component (dihydrolipoamide succinyltransferase)